MKYTIICNVCGKIWMFETEDERADLCLKPIIVLCEGCIEKHTNIGIIK